MRDASRPPLKVARFLGAVIAVGGVLVLIVPATRGPGGKPARFPVTGAVVTLAVAGPEATVTLRLPGRVARLRHAEGAAVYTVVLPFRVTGPLDVAAPAAVDLDRGVPSSTATTVLPTWQPDGSLDLPAPQPVGADGRAWAAVDESDVYGVRLFGVPVREGPATATAIVATVFHGELLPASCWTRGDTVTNSFADQPNRPGRYDSDVWFRVELPGGRAGFIPDARYSRRGHTDVLGLAPCG